MNVYAEVNSIVSLPNLLSDKIISLQNYIKVQLTKKGFSEGHPNYTFFQKDRFHITLQQPENLDPQQEKKFYVLLEKIAQETIPFDIAASINKAKVVLLPAQAKKGYHVVLSFEPSNQLKALAEKIGEQLDKERISYKKYPTYAPHITIGYVWNEQVKDIIQNMQNTLKVGALRHFTVNKITLVKGEVKDNQLINQIVRTIPFGNAKNLQLLSNSLQNFAQELLRLESKLTALVS